MTEYFGTWSTKIPKISPTEPYILNFLILNLSFLNAILKRLSGNITQDDDHMLILNATTLLYVLNFTAFLFSPVTTLALQEWKAKNRDSDLCDS